MMDWLYNQRLENRMKKIWPFSFYFLYYAAMASVLPFLVIFYQSRGFSGVQIGLLTGIPPLITLVGAPFGTGLADAAHRHKLIMGLGLIVAILVTAVLPVLTSFVLIFGLILVFNIFMSPVGSLSDSATMTMLGEYKAMYGKVRVGGTIGWGVFALISATLVDHYGLNIAFWLFSVLMFINFWVSRKFSFGEKSESTGKSGGVMVLLRNRRWVVFLANAFFGGLASMTVASFLYPYMAEMGASETTMGVASLVATLTELPIFFFGDYIIKRIPSRTLFILSLILMGVRSLFFSIASSPNMGLIIHGVGGTLFPAMWLAGVAYAEENAPSGLKSTAQGLLGAMSFGFGSAVGGFLGGFLLGSVGAHRMFLVFGITVLVGLALVEIINRLLPVNNMTEAQVS